MENSKILEVNCSYCGEEMDCPEEMLKAEVHICSFCTGVMEEGMDKKMIAKLSKNERKLSPYYRDITSIADNIFSLAYEKNRVPRDELREISKREIEEGAFHAGIFTAFSCLLHVIGPKIIEDIKNNPRFNMFTIMRKTSMRCLKTSGRTAQTWTGKQ